MYELGRCEICTIHLNFIVLSNAPFFFFFITPFFSIHLAYQVSQDLILKVLGLDGVDRGQVCKHKLWVDINPEQADNAKLFSFHVICCTFTFFRIIRVLV